MENWADKIKERVEEYIAKTDEITKHFSELLAEVNQSTNVRFIEEELIWELRIRDKKVSVKYQEIMDLRLVYDDIGNAIGKTQDDLKETLQAIIIREFKWLPGQE